MKSQLFEQDKVEKEGVAGSFLLQNRHTLKVELNGEVYAKQGAMAAYQGNVEFSFSKWPTELVSANLSKTR